LYRRRNSPPIIFSDLEGVAENAASARINLSLPVILSTAAAMHAWRLAGEPSKSFFATLMNLVASFIRMAVTT
jgi:hypothetical protein